MAMISILMDVLVGAVFGIVVYGIIDVYVTSMNLTPGTPAALLWSAVVIFVPLAVFAAAAYGVSKLAHG
jgi:hypothetical protein